MKNAQHDRKSNFLLLSLALAASCAQPPGSATAYASQTSMKYAGVNVVGPVDWSSGIVFNDAVKASRPWGTPSMPCWGTGYPNAALSDSNGWPVGDAGLCAIDPPTGDLPTGVYKLSFTGQATVSTILDSNVKVSNVVYNSSTNTTTADVTASTGAFEVMLTFTNTRRLPTDTTATGVTNVKLLMPNANPSETFYAPYLAAASQAHTMRFMDWLGTNGNTTALWTNRTLPSHASQNTGKGASFEYAIAFANETGNDPWFNIPDNANDEYVTKLAQLLKYGADQNGNPYTSAQTNPVWKPLNSNLHAYIEFSNEVWNWAFSQTTRLYNRANAPAWAAGTSYAAGAYVVSNGNIYLCQSAISSATTPPTTTANVSADGSGSWTYLSPASKTSKYDNTTNTYGVQLRYIIDRVFQISNLFRSVYGDSAMGSLVRIVYASQAAYPAGTLMPALNYANTIYGVSNKYGNPKYQLNHYLYGLAVAPYFIVPSLQTTGSTAPWPTSCASSMSTCTSYSTSNAYAAGAYATSNGSLYQATALIAGPWAAGKSYAANSKVTSNGNVYVANSYIGTSSTAPAGTGTSIADGSGSWKYVSVAAPRSIPSGTGGTIADGTGSWSYVYTYGDTNSEINQALADIKDQTDALNSPIPNSVIWQFITYAKNFGLHPISYEGGLDTSLDQNMLPLVQSDSFQKSAGLRQMMTNIYTNWFKAGGETFNYYNLVGQPGKSGSWGMLENLEDFTTARWLGFEDVLNMTSIPSPVLGNALPATSTAPGLTLTPSLFTTLSGFQVGTNQYVSAGGASMALLNASVQGYYQISFTVNPSSLYTGSMTLSVDGYPVEIFQSGSQTLQMFFGAGQHVLRFSNEGAAGTASTSWTAPVISYHSS